jgi:NADH:ubiquinone reductase (H+-translocating)
MDTGKNIVIVGGGFAGTTLAKRLLRRLPPGHRVVLVSEESYTTFNPMLAEVVGAAVFPEHVVAPIRQMLGTAAAERSQFVMGRATGVDAAGRTLAVDTLAGPQRLPYEHLVWAFGTRANLALVPGLAEHALPLKLVGDALHIRNRVLQRVARIELETDPAERRRLGHFIVIGGGFSGVETAGSLSDFLRDALRYYPRVRADELQVTVLQDAERLLLELPEPLGRAAARSLQARGVAVHLGARAERVEAGGVALAGGEFIAGATVICTIGTQANPLVAQLACATQRGRIETLPDLSVPGWPGVWALGDCALVRNGTAFALPTAQFAVAEARALARNLLAAIAGRATRPFSHKSRGMMATTGHLKGVALVFGLRLSGLPAWLLWRAYYLLLMPTLGRKVRIFVEWTWSMFFAADITHLRFTRTADADAPHPHPLTHTTR